MFTALIAKPITHESEVKRPPPKRVVGDQTQRHTHTLRTAQPLDDSISDEERYIVKLIAGFFMLLILPAILTLLYIAVNSDVFMIGSRG